MEKPRIYFPFWEDDTLPVVFSTTAYEYVGADKKVISFFKDGIERRIFAESIFTSEKEILAYIEEIRKRTIKELLEEASELLTKEIVIK